jgi:hypothetical protein
MVDMPVALLPVVLVMLVVPLTLFVVVFGKLFKDVECIIRTADADILRGVIAEDDWDGLHHSTTSILDMDKVLSGYSR